MKHLAETSTARAVRPTHRPSVCDLEFGKTDARNTPFYPPLHGARREAILNAAQTLFVAVLGEQIKGDLLTGLVAL
ncbi:MAG: hypothetical protein WAT25_04745 [Paracoccaceae bacterium]